MSITWMPDDNSGMKKFASLDEFLSTTGYILKDTFAGPGMYMINDGKPSKLDIKEGLLNSPGKCIGTIIAR